MEMMNFGADHYKRFDNDISFTNFNIILYYKYYTF